MTPCKIEKLDIESSKKSRSLRPDEDAIVANSTPDSDSPDGRRVAADDRTALVSHSAKGMSNGEKLYHSRGVLIDELPCGNGTTLRSTDPVSNDVKNNGDAHLSSPFVNDGPHGPHIKSGHVPNRIAKSCETLR